MRRAQTFIVVVLCAWPAVAQAAPKYASGFHAEGGLGAAFFLGDNGGYLVPGPAFSMRAGYDLWSWLSVGGVFFASVHEGDVPPPPDREYLQLYGVAAETRLTLRIRRVALFAEGQVGLAAITTNLLDRVGITEPDESATLLLGAGGGIDYHTQNRHLSFGLAGDWQLFSGFDGLQGVAVRVYLRYTK